MNQHPDPVPAIKRINALEKAKNEEFARRIKRYWASFTRFPKVSVVLVGVEFGTGRETWGIRSDMIGGRPR